MNEEEKPHDSGVVEEQSVSLEKDNASTTQEVKKPTDKKIVKWILISVAAMSCLVGIIIAASWLFYDGGLAWNAQFGDYGLDYVSPTDVMLRFNAKDDVLNSVSVESSCDKSDKAAAAEQENGFVQWDLSDGLGKCTVKVKYRIKTIKKTFTIIPTDIISGEGDEDELASSTDVFKIDKNSDEDSDGDGLTNKQEKKYKTKPELSDTDDDGLDDGYEVNTTKTDPLKADTDGDGLDDLNEVLIGLDPLKEDSKGDGTKDGNRKLSYSFKNDSGVKIDIVGTGNIASVDAEIIDGAAISRKDGLIPKLYSFYTDGKMEEATVTIPYTSEQLAAAGISEDDLKLMNYDIDSEDYKVVEATVDKNNKVIIAKLKHFSYYVVGKDIGGDKYKSSNSEVMFVLDNSWSMYTNEQFKKITGQEYQCGLFDLDCKLNGSDAEGKRFEQTGELAEKMASKGMKIGLAEFRADYATANKIGSSADSIKSTLSGMNGNFITTRAGTGIENAILGGSNEFSNDAGNKVLVLLTDGQDTEGFSSSADSIAEKMTDAGIKVCVIGFGEGVYNEQLSMITQRTGCKYSSSSDAGGLDEVFEIVETQLNNELVDLDDDGKMDGIIIADSGFVVNRDGFSFENYGSNTNPGGHCNGMATFAQLYYRKKLPMQHKNKDVDYENYDLSNSYFKDYKSLYDYKLQTKELAHAMFFPDFEYFGLDAPKTYRVFKDGNLAYADPIRKEIDDMQLFDYKYEKSGLDSQQQIDKYGFNYDSVETAILNEDKMQKGSKINEVDRDLFNELRFLQVKQGSDDFVTSGMKMDGVSWLYLIGLGYKLVFHDDAPSEKKSKSYFLQLLTERLKAGEAPTLAVQYDFGGHSTNVIALIQDIKDHNHYYLEIYDNNHAGVRRRLEMECGVLNCLTKVGSDYKADKTLLRITKSEENDLNYILGNASN